MSIPEDPSPAGSESTTERRAFRPRRAGSNVGSPKRVHLNPQQAAQMVERLRSLCLMKGDDVTELEAAVQALRQSGYKQELSQVLREAIWWPESHPHVGALWIRRLLSSNNWDRHYPKSMDKLCRQQGEIGHRAVIEFLETVAAKHRAALVREAVRKHGRWLRKDPQGWCAGARALVGVRLYHPAEKWMADWRKRPPLDLSMLHCLALALRGAGQEHAAQEIVELALAKPEASQQFSIFHLWQAQEQALAGNTAAAVAHFKEVHPEGWEDDSLVLYYMVRGLIRVQRAEGEARTDSFWAAYDRVGDQLGRRRIYKSDMMLRRQYRRCLQRMARDSGQNWTRLRIPWRSADSWSMIVPLLLIPGLQLLLPLYLLRLCTNRHGQMRRG